MGCTSVVRSGRRQRLTACGHGATGNGALANGTATAHGKRAGGLSRRLRQLPLTWQCCDSAEQAGAEVTAMSQSSGQPSSSSSSSSRGGVAAQHGKVGRIRLQHHHSCLRPQQLEQDGREASIGPCRTALEAACSD